MTSWTEAGKVLAVIATYLAMASEVKWLYVFYVVFALLVGLVAWWWDDERSDDE